MTKSTDLDILHDIHSGKRNRNDLRIIPANESILNDFIEKQPLSLTRRKAETYTAYNFDGFETQILLKQDLVYCDIKVIEEYKTDYFAVVIDTNKNKFFIPYQTVLEIKYNHKDAPNWVDEFFDAYSKLKNSVASYPKQKL